MIADGGVRYLVPSFPIQAKQSEAKLKKVSAKDLSPMHIDSLTELLEAVYAEHAAECQESPNLRVTIYEELKGLVQSIMPGVCVCVYVCQCGCGCV